MIDCFFSFLRMVNDDYARVVQAVALVVIAVTSIIGLFGYEGSLSGKSIEKFILKRDNKDSSKGDAALYVPRCFSRIGWLGIKKFKILAVHKYEISEDDMAGYKHLGQNSRPDQWKKLIDIKPSFFGLKYCVAARDPDDILEVIISRDGRENWKIISFNK